MFEYLQVFFKMVSVLLKLQNGVTNLEIVLIIAQRIDQKNRVSKIILIIDQFHILIVTNTAIDIWIIMY